MPSFSSDEKIKIKNTKQGYFYSSSDERIDGKELTKRLCNISFVAKDFEIQDDFLCYLKDYNLDESKEKLTIEEPTDMAKNHTIKMSTKLGFFNSYQPQFHMNDSEVKNVLDLEKIVDRNVSITIVGTDRNISKTLNPDDNFDTDFKNNYRPFWGYLSHSSIDYTNEIMHNLELLENDWHLFLEAPKNQIAFIREKLNENPLQKLEIDCYIKTYSSQNYAEDEMILCRDGQLTVLSFLKLIPMQDEETVEVSDGFEPMESTCNNAVEEELLSYCSKKVEKLKLVFWLILITQILLIMK